jgi:hypothetical protein
MMDWVTFGIDMDVFKNEYLPDQTHWGWDTNIYYIPDSWQSITESIPSYRTHLAIKTGKVSNITVVDTAFTLVPAEFYEIIPRYMNTIYHVDTPNSGKQYYFEYEPQLHSIPSTRPGVSVLNDDRFAITSGKGYSAWDRVPIAKMPKEMLRLLLKWQNERECINMACYELISILPKEWASDDAAFIKLIEALRSMNGPRASAATLRQFSADKLGYVDERRLRLLIDCRITTTDHKQIIKEATANNTIGMIDLNRLRLLVNSSRKTFTYGALKKAAKQTDGDAYDKWFTKYESSRRTSNTPPPLPFRFLPGNIAKLSDLKLVCPDITRSKLLEMNPEWTISPKKMCTHCNKRHYKGCCSDYSHAHRITCDYVNNIQLI